MVETNQETNRRHLQGVLQALDYIRHYAGEEEITLAHAVSIIVREDRQAWWLANSALCIAEYPAFQRVLHGIDARPTEQLDTIIPRCAMN